MYSLDDLFGNEVLWRASDLAVAEANKEAQAIPTGYPVLNSELYGGGWPAGGLVEVLSGSYGIGELRLFVPALNHLSQQHRRWIMFVNPPYIPYAPALDAVHVDSRQLLLVYPKTYKDILWTIEEALTAGHCVAVLAWLHQDEIKTMHLQRLQHRAKAHSVLTLLFRPQSQKNHASAAELRLCLEPTPSRHSNELMVSILKRRGGWPLSHLIVPLNTAPIRTSHNQLQKQCDLWLRKGPHSAPQRKR